LQSSGQPGKIARPNCVNCVKRCNQAAHEKKEGVMGETSGAVRLVEPRRDSEAGGLATMIRREEVEEALRLEEPVDLLLDVERVTGDGGRETQRVALAWETKELERLLGSSTADELPVTFDEGELRRLLDEDVEAHGMRDKLAVITVVAGMAAAGAGAAAGAIPRDEGGAAANAPVAAATVRASEVSTGLGTAAPAQAERASASEMSTGLGVQQPAQADRAAPASEISTGIVGTTPAAPSEISTGIVQEPGATPAEVTTGITAKPTAEPVSADQPSWSPSTKEGVALAGTILALTAVGFALRSRRGPTLAT
jgi:hypothetical protein